MGSKGNVPEVSVLMSTCGGRDGEGLARAVGSVLGQTLSGLELVLCWDGPGEPPEALQETARKDERVRLARTGEKKGLAAALNLCISLSRGRYLARMDDDDVSSPERLERQAAYLEAHPEVWYVGSCAAVYGPEGVWGHRLVPERPGKKDFLKCSPYIHPSVMFRRAVFEGGRGYRTDTRRGEDYELFLRLAAEGFVGHNLQEELVACLEDGASYRRRSLGSRLDEAAIRWQGFARLGVLLPWGWLCAARPLAAACVPPPLILGTKKLYHRCRQGEWSLLEKGTVPGRSINGS